MIDPGISGRVALVTGANHGIGAATVLALARQGCAVLDHFFRPGPAPEGADDTLPGAECYAARQARTAAGVVDAARALGARAAMLEADLADPGAVPHLFDFAERELGPVEILVNNAAVCTADTFIPSRRLTEDDRCADGWRVATLSAESHDCHFAVNSRAPALMMAELASRCAARGAGWGRIINVSTDGAAAFASEVSYGASKHALESYSRAAAVELGPLGITVNVVSSGPVQTGWIDAELEAAVLPTIPLRRIGEPEDIADAILFLASEQARWITGQLLYVGGGHVMPL